MGQSTDNRHMEERCFEETLDKVLLNLKSVLMSKNKSYGDSALNPIRVFSKLSPIEGLCVRIDDKLSRLARAPDTNLGEDTVLDLTGYMLLYLIARELDHEC